MSELANIVSHPGRRSEVARHLERLRVFQPINDLPAQLSEKLERLDRAEVRMRQERGRGAR
ncbi:hypothetical protein GTW51_11045 [Aurantimonas aggregata]|uniref:Uncharacterized protein n=1 Tax=Aurantimonas aggregata TaxID=2047720 RepID=A0A6L9MHC3_9HYPH|nr:hypothetical protein [Aurantimonas aggregata]NDV87234.1 hypothetical protein [Aurantimonas aggregata]